MDYPPRTQVAWLALLCIFSWEVFVVGYEQSVRDWAFSESRLDFGLNFYRYSIRYAVGGRLDSESSGGFGLLFRMVRITRLGRDVYFAVFGGRGAVEVTEDRRNVVCADHSSWVGRYRSTAG